MNCNYFEERLSDFLESALSDTERAAAEAHLQSCEACSKLAEGVRSFIQTAHDLPLTSPPLWLPGKIVANTPLVLRLTWRDWFRAVWARVSEPQFALTALTSVLVLGWMGNMAGISAPDPDLIRHPSAIYYSIEGWATRMYGDAVRTYYSSPIVNTIQCEIHTRIEQFRENS